ncbi:DNA polymerase III subunit delta' [Pseudoalteromonas rubra]|uniref:DNA-directed DNA polymerase n=1 Tax=Pseudoalteromonas rubra TaxID=43658 RepID=A0A5S3WM10_9GAMM|nr:DNA polymerase III subunit delta' [Pseudoalteromonas rubra]TMP29034.1 DNA polymerase III subunit delta' [Pseudoalteromonas rubra]TMP33601.1 DNA polymerase III subunit delta' [Pseudoalteromonas rubra]
MYPWLEPVLSQLQTSYQQQRFHHAQLLYGMVGVGKLELAQSLAAALLCKQAGTSLYACGQCKSCLLLEADNHPDKLLITAETQSISVDAIRGLNEFIFHSAQQGGNKVVVIDGIEKLTESAANALLKTLEEPAKGRYLLLLCNDSARVAATVLSRCNKLNVGVFDGNAVESWLAQQGIHTSQFPWISNFMSQPLLLQKWSQMQQLNDIDYLWQSAQRLGEGVDSDALTKALQADTSLIQVFCGFALAAINNRIVTRQLDFSKAQAAIGIVRRFSVDQHTVLGLNLSLSLSRLCYQLQQTLR